ncbi:hypothetical protein [Peribacillus loiseleuriae]|uniref:hypothetical protein n=1 Tax=Peribacillus loiseleuriae TaxID=1679170 RepID=UPI0012E22E14|nr:hypothetical protein [Peribacillus loiseleuriae]
MVMNSVVLYVAAEGMNGKMYVVLKMRIINNIIIIITTTTDVKTDAKIDVDAIEDVSGSNSLNLESPRFFVLPVSFRDRQFFCILHISLHLIFRPLSSYYGSKYGHNLIFNPS